jgi:hypothetical protein
MFTRGGANHREILRVIFVRPVRKIQPRHVHTRREKPVDHPRRTGGGADGAHNLRVTEIHAFFRGQTELSLSIIQRELRSCDFLFGLLSAVSCFSNG